MPRGGGRGGRWKGEPPSKRGAFHSSSGSAGGAPRVQIPDGQPVDLSRYKDVEFVEIDGSVLEGGGQILRNATAYSCLLCKPIHITKIRAGRSNPGLRPQHLTGIRLIAQLCGGTLMGDSVGSQEVCFVPSALRGGEFVGDTHTAGSICLMLQAALPCLLFAPEASRLLLRGGTNAEMAPPIDYMVQVLRPVITGLGANFDCQIVRRGFYPKGGGEVVVTVHPISHLEPVRLVERGALTQVTLQAYATRDIPSHVVPRVMSAAASLLQPLLGDAPLAKEEVILGKHEAVGNGCGVNCVASTGTGCVFGGNGIGKPGLPAEEVGKQAAEMLALALTRGSCLDDYLQDQLIIFMALARGLSQVCSAPLTLHTKTAIYVAELMTGVKFKEEKIAGSDTVLLSCEGIGLKKRVHA